MIPFLLNALYIQPNQKPEIKYIENSVEAMKELVHGNITSAGIDDGVCAISNDLAQVLQMPYCTEIYGRKFYGPVIILEFTQGGELKSLEQDNIDYYLNLLSH